MKKLLSILLTVFIVMTSFTTNIFAVPEPDGTESNPWLIGTTGSESSVTAYIKDNVLYIKGTGEMADFSTSNLHPWKDVWTSITSVDIGNGVTKIGNYAFYTNNNIESVSIPNSVTTIGECAFCSCQGITSITIPSSVTSIGKSAFESCIKLESIELPSTITSIENHCFATCTSLENISIPDGVSTIGTGVFDGCSKLDNVVLPESITTVGSLAFQNCSNLKKITFKPTTPPTLGIAGEYYNSIFEDCTNLSNIYVPFGTVRTYKAADISANGATIECKEVTITDVLGTVSDFPNNTDSIWTTSIRSKAYKSGTDLKLENTKASLTKAIPLDTTLSQDYSDSNYDVYKANVDGKVYTFSVDVETGELEKIRVYGFENKLDGTYTQNDDVTIFDVLESNSDFPQTDDDKVVPVDAWKNESGEKAFRINYNEDNGVMLYINMPFITGEEKVAAEGNDYVYTLAEGDIVITVKFIMDNNVLSRIYVDGFSSAGVSYSKYDGLYTNGKYTITYGANSTINASSDESARFISNASFSLFDKVEVDDSVVDPSNYEKSEGSTIIDFNKSYISSLTNGVHTLSIVSNDGFAMTTFNVIGNDPAPTPKPKKKTSYTAPSTGVE